MTGPAMLDQPVRAPAPRVRPRIAFFTSEYDTVRTGPGTFARYLRRETERGRFDIVFFSDEMARRTGDHERPVRLPVTLPSPPGMFVRQWAWHEALLQEHRRRPFDLVWFNSSMAAWVASVRERVAPLVIMINDYSNASTTDVRDTVRIAGPYRAFTRWFWMHFERAAARRSDIIVVNSRFLRNEIARRYGIPPARIEVLYKGVDLEQFRPDPARRELSADHVRVLFVKNDYLRGGLPDVIGGLARVPYRTTLTVSGPPPSEFARIRDLATRSGYRGALELIGRTPRERVPALFATADIVCVASRVEALGVTFLESLASGVPTIGTTAGGIPEVLDDGKAGWLVPPYSADAIAQAAREIVERPEERRRRVAHGLAHVRQFGIERAMERFEQLAERLASGARDEAR